MAEKEKIKVLLEMRPALDGFAGIPQEVRLLFRGLRKIENLEVEGMLQTSGKILAKGVPARPWLPWATSLSEAKKINKYSRVVISIAEKPFQTIFDKLYAFFERRLYASALTVKTVLFAKKIKLTKFDSRFFQDFVWRSLFSKTLPASDYELVSSAGFRVNTVPWNTMHRAGLNSLNLFATPRYPQLNLEDVDIFIGQTPYPARLNRSTKLVIRYHDAIPVFMPHTIPDKSLHQATHYFALMSNVRSGAWFACVSEATRQDLIKIFPEAEARSVTIHNTVSHHYYNEASRFSRVPEIIRSRLSDGDKTKGVDLEPKFFSLREKEAFYRKSLAGEFPYLLVVSTIEPRKNHTRLIAAWEVLKSEVDPRLKLVVVGTLGWDYSPIIKGISSWIDRGEVFMLSSVPSPDLRVLYRHAAATVCPSLGEGFDFSGVEAMASGGVTVASEIPVHREVYGDAAEYFDPYSTASLVGALKKVLYSENSDAVRARMVQHGSAMVERYKPEAISPQWETFLQRVSSAQHPMMGSTFAATRRSRTV